MKIKFVNFEAKVTSKIQETDQEFAIVSPRDHLLSELIARHCHTRISHRGIEDTMA